MSHGPFGASECQTRKAKINKEKGQTGRGQTEEERDRECTSKWEEREKEQGNAQFHFPQRSLNLANSLYNTHSQYAFMLLLYLICQTAGFELYRG